METPEKPQAPQISIAPKSTPKSLEKPLEGQKTQPKLPEEPLEEE